MDASKRWRVDPMAERLRTDIGGKVGRTVGMSVGVAVEAGHSATGTDRASVLGGVELLLRERGQQQAQSV